MIRKIIHIDRNKCNGCGACAEACHEGAIAMEGGRARLLRDDYCDGLGDCLPACPTGAITFTEREAAEYDRVAVLQHMASRKAAQKNRGEPPMGCPGRQARSLHPRLEPSAPAAPQAFASQLAQWPVQIKLVPVKAPYFEGAKLLVAADCTAYAYARFHEEFMRGRVTIVGCPKLDSVDYSEKLTEILKANDIRDVAIVRMEVPCCGGLEQAVKTALMNCGKMIPWRVVTISTEGNILD